MSCSEARAYFGRASAIKLPDSSCRVAGHIEEPRMPPLTQLMFGAAIADLIALALMLLLPGCKETSRPRQAHVASAPSPMQ